MCAVTQVLEIKPDYAQAIDKRAKIYASQVKLYMHI